MAVIKAEKLVKNLKSKKVFNYVDSEKKINTLSREIYQNKDEEIHYPRGFDGAGKYKNVKKIIYQGFKGRLPIGVFKSAKYGWGFTKPMYPFAEYIDKKLLIEEVVINKTGKVEIEIPKFSVNCR